MLGAFSHVFLFVECVCLIRDKVSTALVGWVPPGLNCEQGPTSGQERRIGRLRKTEPTPKADLPAEVTHPTNMCLQFSASRVNGHLLGTPVLWFMTSLWTCVGWFDCRTHALDLAVARAPGANEDAHAAVTNSVEIRQLRSVASREGRLVPQRKPSSCRPKVDQSA